MNNERQILLAALKRFAARGYDGVGVQEITESAGVTKPTLYHYFKSKQGLLKKLLSSHYDELFASLQSLNGNEAELPIQLERWVVTYFDFARKHPQFYRLQLALWFAPHESEGYRSVIAFQEIQQQMLEALFVAAGKQHRDMSARHRQYAATFLGTINTYIGIALNGYAQLDLKLARLVVHQFLHGIL